MPATVARAKGVPLALAVVPARAARPVVARPVVARAAKFGSVIRRPVT
jgi:hypothetical protein